MAGQSKFESLPVEVFNNILSHLIIPRSRLPGLTERQSTYDFPERALVKHSYHTNLTAPPDFNRFADDLFTIASIQHPFNTLALTSRHTRSLVESYCAYLVKFNNLFNLPFAHFIKYGPNSVHPSLGSLVYRRLWLWVAPRCCIYCGYTISVYAHNPRVRLIAGCGDCFYAQALLMEEVEKQYHFSRAVLEANGVRGIVAPIKLDAPAPGKKTTNDWVLRADVEALALRVYKTKAYHNKDSRNEDVCSKCVELETVDLHLQLEKGSLHRPFLEDVPHRQPTSSSHPSPEPRETHRLVSSSPRPGKTEIHFEGA
ncbi:hypothetical protein BS50DRAFT_568401 [Corynespora cassiicola Philippines]|uniref:Uncharacterized protein n=1 Tax=Corynespora cassiicola Philippines TaxID=1448308 RepID=A0A2T2P544_CORCC|nr:hypothetical protein BS50DRAFT_568401 [Corynespora cassiicola Philippines]